MGNKLPLLFTNQVPPSAILLKKPQQNMVNSLANSSASCGSTVPEEQHAWVTSLEAMMDFAIRMLGTNLRPISTPAGKWQLYTVTGAARTITDKVCGCHKKDSLPFAIYGCLYKMNTKVRVVPLVGDDGTILEAINVCHMNTASWDSNYLLFRLMKAKPGTPVCHFLATDDIVWITK
ncbi:BURP domain protein RD22-like [Chenopodium quinoa]|uniref:BURP domain protein RD22-like n=1 Tax=Chenopodium quinoa TaxID=63459 RepID=UPI000B7844A7|nr:BURP domain protein RD22-like [Chenopodium quinoa]